VTNDPLEAMKAHCNHIEGTLFPWLREEVEQMTEAHGRLVTTLDLIGLEAFVAVPPRGPGRQCWEGTTTNALIERLDVDNSLRRILGRERRA
jgi:hypothetical protein